MKTIIIGNSLVPTLLARKELVVCLYNPFMFLNQNLRASSFVQNKEEKKCENEQGVFKFAHRF